MKRTPLRRVSKHRAGETKEYVKLRKQFLAQHPICQLWCEQNNWRDNGDGTYSDGCYNGPEPYSANELIETLKAPRSEEVHHRAGGKNRKATYLRTDTWMAVSKEGHRYIHDNPKLAYERGWLLTKIPDAPSTQD